MEMLPTIMPLLMFQKASNLISIIASVSLGDTHAITSLAKLTALITRREFLLFGPPAAFFDHFGGCAAGRVSTSLKSSGEEGTPRAVLAP